MSYYTCDRNVLKNLSLKADKLDQEAIKLKHLAARYSEKMHEILRKESACPYCQKPTSPPKTES